MWGTGAFVFASYSHVELLVFAGIVAARQAVDGRRRLEVEQRRRLQLEAEVAGVVERVLLAPLAATRPAELVAVGTRTANGDDPYGLSPFVYDAVERETSSFASVGYYIPQRLDDQVVPACSCSRATRRGSTNSPSGSPSAPTARRSPGA